MSKYVKNWQSSGRGDVKRWEGCEKRKEKRSSAGINYRERMYHDGNEKEQIANEKEINKRSSNFYAVVSYVGYNGESCFCLCRRNDDGR